MLPPCENVVGDFPDWVAGEEQKAGDEALTPLARRGRRRQPTSRETEPPPT